MKKVTTIASGVLLGLLANSAMADIGYICSHADKERKIDVVYKEPNSKVPCDVQYTKDGNTEVLWQAANLEGYCEQKAEEFVQKQVGWGWQCNEPGTIQADSQDQAEPQAASEAHAHMDENATPPVAE